MALKAIFGILAMLLMLAFLGSIYFKLKQVALGAVILIGVAMMLVEWWQSLKEKD